jgi:SAM-dependent methyltransferase
MELVTSNELVLDCGAGYRPEYFDNVVNFEIVDYPSTDVLGVGEVLPFKDRSFDAVISNAVLEHVKYPWLCASEILRVLKPGGTLFCSVPFLQPLHGYPHHYFNMSAEGIKSLFEGGLDDIEQYVPDSTSPIWSLTWFLRSWSRGLPEETRASFEDLRIGDLLGRPEDLLSNSFVTELREETRFEIASATVLRGRKKF